MCKPVDQVDPPPAVETGLDVARTAAPYPDEACQGSPAYLARGVEAEDEPLQGEVALGPHSTSPHGYPAWACKVGHKLPSCLGEKKARRGQQTHPCISDMQLNNMHYYVTQCPPFHTCTISCCDLSFGVSSLCVRNILFVRFI